MHLLKDAKKVDQVSEEKLIEYTATIVSGLPQVLSVPLKHIPFIPDRLLLDRVWM